jgi:hypothetical protein
MHEDSARLDDEVLALSDRFRADGVRRRCHHLGLSLLAAVSRRLAWPVWPFEVLYAQEQQLIHPR